MTLEQNLVAFLDAIKQDGRISSVHISLYVSLLREWQLQGELKIIQVTRDEMMQSAKISAYRTYYRSMKELQRYGYIKYIPSPNPKIKTEVCLLQKNT